MFKYNTISNPQKFMFEKDAINKELLSILNVFTKTGTKTR